MADANGTTFMLLNLVDLGSEYQIECVLRGGHGIPTSLECLDALMQYWISWQAIPNIW